MASTVRALAFVVLVAAVADADSNNEASCKTAEGLAVNSFLQRMTGRMEEAHSTLQQAVALCPTVSTLIQLGDSYQYLKDEPAAARSFQAALELNATQALQRGIAQRFASLAAALSASPSTSSSSAFSAVPYVPYDSLSAPTVGQAAEHERLVSLHWATPFWLWQPAAAPLVPFIGKLSAEAEKHWRAAWAEEEGRLALADAAPEALSKAFLSALKKTVAAGLSQQQEPLAGEGADVYSPEEVDILSAWLDFSSGKGGREGAGWVPPHASAFPPSSRRRPSSPTPSSSCPSSSPSAPPCSSSAAPSAAGDTMKGSTAAAPGAGASRQQLLAVFVLAAGEQAEADVSFSDPRLQAAPVHLPLWFQIDCPLRQSVKAGELHLFPPWIRRTVFPNAAGQPRVLLTALLSLPVRFDLWAASARVIRQWTVELPPSPSSSSSPSSTFPAALILRWPTPVFEYTHTAFADPSSATSASLSSAAAEQEVQPEMEESGTATEQQEVAGEKESLNARLSRVLAWLEAQDVGGGLRRSNKGGWQSEPFLFSKTAQMNASFSGIEELRSFVYASVIRYLDIQASHSFLFRYTDTFPAPEAKIGTLEIDIAFSWGCINRPGDFNSAHTHPGALISGVYYISNGGDEESSLYLMDPTPHAHLPCSSSSSSTDGCPSGDVRVRSTPGKVVLFPSWLEHYVPPHASVEGKDTRRMAVAFNVIVRHVDDRTRPPPLRFAVPASAATGVRAMLKQLGWGDTARVERR